MNWLNSYRILPLVLALVCGTLLGVTVQSFAGKKTAAAEGASARLAKTVYKDVSVFGRKDKAAKRMTKMHQEYGREGWNVQNIVLYTENGDMQGFFVTYVK